MASINFESIESKANEYLNSKNGRSKLSGKVKDKMTTGGTSSPPQEAAEKFIEILKETISNDAGGLASVSGSILPSYSDATKVEDGVYAIEIDLDKGVLSRESFYPKGEYVDNIVALLNKGYEANRSIWGTWHGHRIRSLASRKGSHALEEAKSTFMSLYGDEYGVIDIKIDDIYL